MINNMLVTISRRLPDAFVSFCFSLYLYTAKLGNLFEKRKELGGIFFGGRKIKDEGGMEKGIYYLVNCGKMSIFAENN